MDFIFMLTRQDRTISDCLELFRLARPLGLKHVGFKDIGVPPSTLAALNDAIRAAGATIGSALFDGSYAPDKGVLASQIAAVQADCAAAVHA